MRQLAVFIIIMFLVVTPSCKFLREKGFIGRKADTMAVWQAKQDSMRVSDSIRKIDKEKSEWESRYKFNIILGSFITPEYARSFSADLSQKGYKTRILKLEGTKFEMVSVEAHDSFRNAINRLKQFQDTVATDAWLYVFPKK
jgi:hypothetical protein